MNERETPEGWGKVRLGDLVSPSTARIEPTAAGIAPFLSLEHIEPSFRHNQIVEENVLHDFIAEREFHLRQRRRQAFAAGRFSKMIAG